MKWQRITCGNESDLLTRKGYLVLGGNPTVLDSYRLILWKCGYLVSTDNDGEWRVRKPIPATLSVNKAKRFAYTGNGQPADPENS